MKKVKKESKLENVKLYEIYAKQIKEIVGMGFTKYQAFSALKLFDGKVDLAVNELLENGDQHIPTDEDPVIDLTESDPNKNLMIGSNKQDEVWDTSSFNKNIEITKIENFLGKGNLFAGIYLFIHHKLEVCGANCVICDSPLGFEGMKPTVCENTLCIHSLEQYSLGVDLIDEMKNNADVMDLLVQLTYCAATLCVGTNGVRDLDPYPRNIEGYTFDPKSTLDSTKSLIKIMDAIPKMDDLVRRSFKSMLEMRKHFENKHEHAYSIFNWIISSNRAHIVRVPKNQIIKEISDVCDQFILVSSNPTKEAAFREKRANFGSFWAFHGSNIGNWANILRLGLRNFSNTSKMSAGAAYGPGIYLGSNMSTSLGYMTNHGYTYWGNSEFGSINCMALCEVIKDSNGYKTFDWGYTVQDETLLTTRYLLVFGGTNKKGQNTNIAASSLTIPKEMYK